MAKRKKELETTWWAVNFYYTDSSSLLEHSEIIEVIAKGSQQALAFATIKLELFPNETLTRVMVNESNHPIL